MIRGITVVISIGEDAVFFYFNIIGHENMIYPFIRAFGIVKAVKGPVVGIDHICYIITVIEHLGGSQPLICLVVLVDIKIPR